MKWFLKISLGLLLLIFCFLLFHYQSVIYGIRQLKGQLSIITNSIPIDDVLSQKELPDSLRNKLLLINDIKSFAENDLGLLPSDNYSSFYDEKDQTSLWMLTASPSFKIEAYQWEFPILGTFSYKGYFNHQLGLENQKELDHKGFDTQLKPVSAWSTLGWFNDPILSSMLNRSEGALADIIIHELCHHSIYVKNNISYNENLANFIGEKGAIAFLKQTYGEESSELSKHLKSMEKQKIFSKFMLEASQEMHNFYIELEAVVDANEKQAQKEKKLNEIKYSLVELNYFSDSATAMKRLKKFELNNASFTGFKTYSEKQLSFEEEFKEHFHSSLKDFIKHQLKTHGKN